MTEAQLLARLLVVLSGMYFMLGWLQATYQQTWSLRNMLLVALVLSVINPVLVALVAQDHVFFLQQGSWHIHGLAMIYWFALCGGYHFGVWHMRKHAQKNR